MANIKTTHTTLPMSTSPMPHWKRLDHPYYAAKVHYKYINTSHTAFRMSSLPTVHWKCPHHVCCIAAAYVTHAAMQIYIWTTHATPQNVHRPCYIAHVCTRSCVALSQREKTHSVRQLLRSLVPALQGVSLSLSCKHESRGSLSTTVLPSNLQHSCCNANVWTTNPTSQLYTTPLLHYTCLYCT